MRPNTAQLLRLGVIALILAAGAARAQAPWPAKPIRVIVPGGAGGVVDLRARWVTERLARSLGQPLLVEPQPGAGGRIGTETAIRSAPDGYTLLVTHQGTVAVQPHLFRLAYDPLAQLEHVTSFGAGVLVLAVHPSVQATTVRELIALARSASPALSFASPGIGTPPHLAAELFRHMAGLPGLHVPYKGGGQAASDLVGGHVAWAMDGLTVLQPHVKAGRLRALAVTGTRRIAAMPDVATVAEAGVPGYEYVGWVGLAAPLGTPKPVLERLQRESAAILAQPEAAEYFGPLGVEPGGAPSEQFTAFVHAEHAKWGKVIRDAGIKAE
jgi:tripartite-type tricarboxylate transporter receptor subunit TctC